VAAVLHKSDDAVGLDIPKLKKLLPGFSKICNSPNV